MQFPKETSLYGQIKRFNNLKNKKLQQVHKSN